jgi:hypothetical protein
MHSWQTTVIIQHEIGVKSGIKTDKLLTQYLFHSSSRRRESSEERKKLTCSYHNNVSHL